MNRFIKKATKLVYIKQESSKEEEYLHERNEQRDTYEAFPVHAIHSTWLIFIWLFWSVIRNHALYLAKFCESPVQSQAALSNHKWKSTISVVCVCITERTKWSEWMWNVYLLIDCMLFILICWRGLVIEPLNGEGNTADKTWWRKNPLSTLPTMSVFSPRRLTHHSKPACCVYFPRILYFSVWTLTIFSFCCIQ